MTRPWLSRFFPTISTGCRPGGSPAVHESDWAKAAGMFAPPSSCRRCDRGRWRWCTAKAVRRAPCVSLTRRFLAARRATPRRAKRRSPNAFTARRSMRRRKVPPRLSRIQAARPGGGECARFFGAPRSGTGGGLLPCPRAWIERTPLSLSVGTRPASPDRRVLSRVFTGIRPREGGGGGGGVGPGRWGRVGSGSFLRGRAGGAGVATGSALFAGLRCMSTGFRRGAGHRIPRATAGPGAASFEGLASGALAIWQRPSSVPANPALAVAGKRERRPAAGPAVPAPRASPAETTQRRVSGLPATSGSGGEAAADRGGAPSPGTRSLFRRPMRRGHRGFGWPEVLAGARPQVRPGFVPAGAGGPK